MKPLPSSFPGRLIFWYYAATVGFVLLDYGAAVNVRVAFLDGMPVWRIAYYGFCAFCFLAIQRWPRWSGTIAAGESLINLSALLISTGMRVFVPFDVEGGQGSPLSTSDLGNFLLTGTISYAAWRQRSAQMFAELSGRS